jgi:hypothetical protein
MKWVDDESTPCPQCNNPMEETCEVVDENVDICFLRCRCCEDSECLAELARKSGL